MRVKGNRPRHKVDPSDHNGYVDESIRVCDRDTQKDVRQTGIEIMLDTVKSEYLHVFKAENISYLFTAQEQCAFHSEYCVIRSNQMNYSDSQNAN